MAQKTCVAVRFTTEISEARRLGFVNELARLIVFRLKENRGKKMGEESPFTMQWLRVEELVFIVNVFGKHETSEVRKVISDVAEETAQKQLPVVLDIVME